MNLLFQCILWIYFVGIGLLCFQSLFRAYLAYHARTPLIAPVLPHFEPKVCIQIPIYNEKFVVTHILDSCLQLNYPQHKIRVQILDDSTDETTSIIRAWLKTQQSTITFELIHRPANIGYKAGALQHGLELCEEAYIAIFDTDFSIHPNFLSTCLPYFLHPKVGMVQSAWGFKNPNENWLTSNQALGLHAHFSIEQQAKNQLQIPFSFNGTAGIWRKSCIVDAGGWKFNTLTEDLELSYRALMKGWQFQYCGTVVNPSLLPSSLDALKIQQNRWTEGSIQTLKSSTLNLLKSPLSLHKKAHGLFHLSSPLAYLLLLITSLLSIFLPMLRTEPSFGLYFNIGMAFSIGLIALIYFYKVSSSLKPLAFGIRFIEFITYAFGLLAVHNKAIFRGLFGNNHRFVRTPKLTEGVSNTRHSFVVPWLELSLLSLFAFALCIDVFYKDPILFFYHMLICIGLFRFIKESIWGKKFIYA